MNRLESLARRFINQFQGGFPVDRHPFRFVAARLGTREATLIPVVESLVEEGWLSRFGPVYNASRMGGAQTLAALEVPEEDFGRVTGIVNGYDAVAHNYRREHRLNMWFVVATERIDGISRTLDAIGESTGLTVYEFPKTREFHLGLYLRLDEQGGVDTVPGPEPGRRGGYVFDSIDRDLTIATQGGLPIDAEPYAGVAGRLGCPEREVHERLRRMLECGVARRIGAVPNHYRLGLFANGMTVWDVPDEVVECAGAEVGALPFVSHCYTRSRHDGVWPYNLFAMVHGRNRSEVESKTGRIARVLGERCRARDVLVSSACLKKTGLRLAA